MRRRGADFHFTGILQGFPFHWSLFFHVSCSPSWLLYFFVLFLIFQIYTRVQKTLYVRSLFSHLPHMSFFVARYTSREITFSRVQLIVVTFSSHIFYLKGVLVSSDLGAAWSATFIVHTGGDSPIKDTFVYLSVPISMHKSGQARRFIALPNVVKHPSRDTHREAGSFRS